VSEARRRAVTADALIYAGCGAGAALIWLLATIPQYREWARLAWGPYAAGALMALVLRHRRGSGGIRTRVALAVAVFSGTALIPMALEVSWRAHSGPGFHAQSETIITEEAARAFVHGEDPYSATYLNGPLAARPLGTKTHFPYLPGMLIFGLPRALGMTTAVTDARIPFALAAMAAIAAALRLTRREPPAKLRILQALFVLPITTLLMATGGDDVPVMALMILSLALLDDEHPVASGIALGAALAMKQTAWVLLPFLAVVAARRRGPLKGSAIAFAGSAVVVAAAAIVPFVVWNPGAFIEDAVRFPLGLGHQQSAAGTTTIGSLLIHAFPAARFPLTMALVTVVAVAAVYLLVRRPPRTPGRAAVQAGVVFALAMVLAPAARSGYAIYPVSLVAWGVLAARTGPALPSLQRGVDPRGRSDGGSITSRRAGHTTSRND
jgi:hypothetical protein